MHTDKSGIILEEMGLSYDELVGRQEVMRERIRESEDMTIELCGICDTEIIMPSHMCIRCPVCGTITKPCSACILDDRVGCKLNNNCPYDKEVMDMERVAKEYEAEQDSNTA